MAKVYYGLDDYCDVYETIEEARKAAKEFLLEECENSQSIIINKVTPIEIVTAKFDVNFETIKN